MINVSLSLSVYIYVCVSETQLFLKSELKFEKLNHELNAVV
jgi:hypothetical protein